MLKKCICILIVLTHCANAREQIGVTVESDIYQYAQTLIADRPILEVTDFSGPNTQRDVVEFIYIQQALLLGGLDVEFVFNHGNYDARNLQLLKDGMLLISFDSIWKQQAEKISDDVYISSAVINKGEYWAGIYTSPANTKALSISSISDFQQLSVASNKHWLVDWQTLTDINPKKLVHEEEWLSMARLVDKQWVDVMLAPFIGNPPFTYQGNNYQLVAVPNVKIALNDSRHILVSKRHPLGEQTFTALEKGLSILRDKGIIKKAYRQCGFINAEVNNWHVLNN